MDKDSIAHVIDALYQLYPEARAELHFSNPFETLIATILAAQCTDKRVNIVTERLFADYPDAAALGALTPEALEPLIRECGLFRTKAKNIIATCHVLTERYGGQVPQTIEELVALPGVGRKTANLVLSDGFGIRAGVVVDTHVGRLARRMGLSDAQDPKKVERDLMRLFSQKYWGLLSHWLILHGRALCAARAPRCAQCPLAEMCPTLGVSSSGA